MSSPYKLHNNEIAVKLSFLVSDKCNHPLSLCLTSYRNMNQRLNRPSRPERWVQKAHKGAEALVAFESLPQEWKHELIARFGEPERAKKLTPMQQFYQFDVKAFNFFSKYQLHDGRQLPSEQIHEYAVNASVLNLMKLMREKNIQMHKDMGQKPLKNPWEIMAERVRLFRDTIPHTLPENVDVLRKKYNEYHGENGGYSMLISGKFGKTNAMKITPEIGRFLTALYGQPTKMPIPEVMRQYNQIRAEKQWPSLTEQRVIEYLHKPEVMRLWILTRDGSDLWKNSFGYKTKRDLDSLFPNAYWAMDGSKLDWYYLNEEGKIAADARINLLCDIHSEMVLGYSLSKSENWEEHFKVIKMAVDKSSCRPFLLTYDNQSGHKTRRMQELYSALVAKEGGVHYPHRAYSHSNPMEGIFSRIQQEKLNTVWWSDKQSVTAKKTSSRPNLEFIKANKDKLPRFDQLPTLLEKQIQEWNSAVHPRTGMSREAAYAQTMPMREELDLFDSIELFWVNETKPVTYQKDGLRLKVGKKEYWFEVQDDRGLPCIDFRAENVGAKFIVRYEPETLSSAVQLMRETPNGLEFVALAKKKQELPFIAAIMKEGDRELVNQYTAIKDIEMERDLAKMRAIFDEFGMHPEKQIEHFETQIKEVAFLNKEQSELVEAAYSTNSLNRLI